jgi:hypothetical protein
VLPDRIEDWSLTSLQQRLVKTGGRLAKHARYYWPMLADENLVENKGGDRKVSEESVEDEAVPGFRLPGKGREGASRTVGVARDGTEDHNCEEMRL